MRLLLVEDAGDAEDAAPARCMRRDDASGRADSAEASESLAVHEGAGALPGAFPPDGQGAAGRRSLRRRARAGAHVRARVARASSGPCAAIRRLRGPGLQFMPIA